MMSQKLKAKIKWKQNECFVSTELFIIAKSQSNRALILGFHQNFLIYIFEIYIFEI
jgi:hypothetical protein